MRRPSRPAYRQLVLNIDRRVRSLLASEAERTVDAALASELVEAVARSLAEHRVPERLAAELDATQLATQVLQSPAVREAVADLIASDEVRRGLERTASGYGEELVNRLRLLLERADDKLHRSVSPCAGAVARAVAFVLDLALVQAVVVVGAASVALVLSLVGAGTSSAAAHAVGGIVWVLAVAVYFAAFWTLAGQTPGMRVAGVRLTTSNGAPPSLSRSLLRFVFLLVSIAIAFLGFVPMFFDARRRGLHDYAADTTVTRTRG